MHEMGDRFNDFIRVGTGNEVCHDRMTNKYAFVKTIRYNKVHGVPCTVIREVSIQRELDHENIVRLLDVRADTKKVTLFFDYSSQTTLKDLMETSQSWDITPLRRKVLLYQILTGLSYCHSHKILYRNMNPKSILVDLAYPVVRLANFGISREVDVPRKELTGKVGTLQYMAPEMLFGCKQYSYPVDIWAAGCIFGQMVKGKKLFNGATPADMLTSIFSILGKPDEQTWPGVTKLYPFLHKIQTIYTLPQELRTDVPGLGDSGVDLLYRMLCLDPSKRITAHEALNHLYFRDIEDFKRPWNPEVPGPIFWRDT